MTTKIAPFGSWPSPITASALTRATVGISEPRFDGDTLYWLESRPEEKGRTTIVRLPAQVNAKPETLLPHPINVRSKVNEYGGGSYCIANGIAYFVVADDQRIYRCDCESGGKPQPVALTPEGPWRYADLVIDEKRQCLLAVCEDHSQPGSEPETYLVAIPNNVDERNLQAPQILLRGCDFYSSLNLSADGDKLCWLCWDHPNMPWDNCECWIAEFDDGGQITNPCKVVGNGQESIFQPRWSVDGSLFYVSDRSNWWNLYRHQSPGSGSDRAHCVLEKEVEFASPQWVFGLSTYDFIDQDTLMCCFNDSGSWHLASIDINTGTMTELQSELNDIAYIRCSRSGLSQCAFIGATAQTLPKLFRIHIQPHKEQSFSPNNLEVVTQSSNQQWNTGIVSEPKAIQCSVPGSRSGAKQSATTFAFFYPPKNSDYIGPETEKPPLIVLCHGGPTASTRASLNLKIQFWTSRGFAVVDINYRGSTGYGREYRQQLNGLWGVTDVEDAAAVVRFLTQQGWIDPQKVAIKGSSAGGYTVLAALTFTDVFKAGASLYGIGDLETLAQDTHKFESRYMDTLVGPYPEQKQLYRQRSPIHSVENLNCPVIFFQGLEDKVVPPNQAQAMVKALDAKNIPVAYIEFAEEGHGFRQAANIQRAIEAELFFYGKIFNIPLSENIEPVTILNLK